jgi:hypothetical protein
VPRPISWLPRLHEIARSVANSVRSHYGRRDLEQLFELQPRAAQKLLELLPVVPVGTSHLVEREVLAGFLDRVRDADDVPALIDQIRQEKAQASRKKLRSLVRRDLDPIDLASLPQSVGLSRGRLEVSFRSVEELAESLLIVARILETDGDRFAQEFEPEQPEPEPEPADAGEIEELFAELERIEAERGIKRWEKAEAPVSAETAES